MQLSLRQFEVFLAVTRAKSLRRAAEVLHLSQPALSQHVAELERELGRGCSTASGGAWRSPRPGRVLEDHALRLFATLTSAREAIAELGGLKRGSLLVGASTTPGIYVLLVLDGQNGGSGRHQTHGRVPAGDVRNRGQHSPSEKAVMLREIVPEWHGDLDFTRTDGQELGPHGVHEREAAEAATHGGLEIRTLRLETGHRLPPFRSQTAARWIARLGTGGLAYVLASFDLHPGRTTWSNPSA